MHVYPRIIPVLLLEGERLVKTEQFGDARYVGDPVNVISIFNDLEVDELVLLDIGAARSRESVPLDASWSGSCPRRSSRSRTAAACGTSHKPSESSRQASRRSWSTPPSSTLPMPCRTWSQTLGAQAVVGALDVRRHRGGLPGIRARAGLATPASRLTSGSRLAERVGVGEILVTSIDREGTRTGFDLDLVRHVAESANVPVIAHGGADTRDDLVAPIEHSGASAVAAGTAFVMQAGRESVLINYPSRDRIDGLFAHLFAGTRRNRRFRRHVARP